MATLTGQILKGQCTQKHIFTLSFSWAFEIFIFETSSITLILVVESNIYLGNLLY